MKNVITGNAIIEYAIARFDIGEMKWSKSLPQKNDWTCFKYISLD